MDSKKINKFTMRNCFPIDYRLLKPGAPAARRKSGRSNLHMDVDDDQLAFFYGRIHTCTSTSSFRQRIFMLSRLLNKNKNPVPAYEKKRFFASEEKAFYTRLRRALPSCYIFPDIELSALITPASTDPRQKRAELKLLAGRKVAYAVFDARLNLLVVIDLAAQDGAGGEAASNDAYLKSAGIKRICWSEETRPSTEEILRALAPFAAALPPKPTPASGMPVAQAEAARTGSANPPEAAHASDPARGNLSCLSVAALEFITPGAHIKTGYPHVWQRICLFCVDPKNLAQYLTSLSIQDRGNNRAGFPPGVMLEIADIQNANNRFIKNTTTHRAWNSVFVR